MLRVEATGCTALHGDDDGMGVLYLMNSLRTSGCLCSISISRLISAKYLIRICEGFSTKLSFLLFGLKYSVSLATFGWNLNY